MNNKHAYTYKTISYPTGMFNPWIDMVYLLTMVKSDRQFRTELNKIPLFHKVIIQENSG